jgi:hypothetical protein
MCSCIEVLQDINVKTARKDYPCDSSFYIKEMLSDFPKGKLTFAEKRLIVEAKRDGWKILKGQPYEKQRNKFDGIINTFRSRPGLSKICNKYEFFPEC